MNQKINVTQVVDVTVQDKDVTQSVDDQRLKPKERKHPELWQLYLVQQELVEFRKKHLLRLSSANRGVSNLMPDLEQSIIEQFELDRHIEPKNNVERTGLDRKGDVVHDTPSLFHQMVLRGQEVGPIWDWLLSHKGIGESLAAKTLALIDDIRKFDTVTKLWRYAGYGLNDYWCDAKGKAICPAEGWKWIEVKPKVKYRIWTVVSDHHQDVTHLMNVNGSNSHHTDVTQMGDAIPLDKQWAYPQNKTLEPLQRVDFLEPDPDWQLKSLSDRLCKHYHAPYCTPLKSTLFLIAYLGYISHLAFVITFA